MIFSNSTWSKEGREAKFSLGLFDRSFFAGAPEIHRDVIMNGYGATLTSFEATTSTALTLFGIGSVGLTST